MRGLFLSFGLAALCSSCAVVKPPGAPASVSVTTQAEVLTEFHPDAVLLSVEIHAVLSLARQHGLSDVAKISTHPLGGNSARFAIKVVTRSVVDERETSYVELHAFAERRWADRARANPGSAKSEESFHMDSAIVFPQRSATFVIAGSNKHLLLSEDISLRDADRVVAAFAAGRVHPSDEQVRNDLFGKSIPALFRLGGVGQEKDGTYLVSFGLGPQSATHLRCAFDDTGGMVVLDSLTLHAD